MASDYDEGFSFADAYDEFGDDLLGKIFPNGTYQMKVKTAQAAMTGTGKHCFKVVLEFVGGKFKGKTVPDQLTWTPSSDVAARIFAQSMGVLGAPQDWIKTNKPSPEQIAARITGTVVETILAEDEWNGAPRNKVRYSKTIALKGGAKAANGSTLTKSTKVADTSGEELLVDDSDELETPAKKPTGKEKGEPAGDVKEDPWASASDDDAGTIDWP
jgi:hypothetical protein